MGIRKGTTPTVALIVHAELVDWPTIVVTIESGGELHDFTNADGITVEPFELEGEACTLIRVPLVQAETLGLTGRCRVQVRAVDDDGEAVATCIRTTRALEVLNTEILGG